MRALVLSTLLLSLWWASAQARGQDSPTLVPIVIELFTSEGCSSCPPADLLLQKLDKNQPIPGAQLIVLSEHVTYWDHDGWKDPNSSPPLTDRQSSYESALGSDTAYTPQMIVDGTHELHLRNSKETQDVLMTAARTAKLPVRIGDVAFDSSTPLLRTHIEAGGNEGKHNADVYLVIALDHVESEVLRGENGGKHLVHVAVVQQLTKIGKLEKGKAFAKDVQLKLKPGTDPKNLRLIAFIQEPGPGELLGAAQWNPRP
jgi:hypothetical protein